MKSINYIFIFCLAALSFTAQAQEPFYTEDFANGLPDDWSSIKVAGNNTPSAQWFWTNVGPTGDFAINPIASTSRSNGWMIFDSDLNCSGNQDAWLVFPKMDFSDKESIFLVFETYFRSYNDQATIEVSTDSTNWQSIEVFPNITPNDFGGDEENPQIVRLNLTSYLAGAETAWIAFRFLSNSSFPNGGCAYSWQIDDVQLYDFDARPENDLRINPFFAVAPNYATPASQVEEFGFVADIANTGQLPQTGAVLNISIVNQITSDTLYSANLDYPTIESDSTNENRLFGSFTPPAEPGIYRGIYTIIVPNGDDAPENNTRTFDFFITDTTFAKTTTTGAFATSPIADNSYSWGNDYYTPNGDGWYARYASFSVRNVRAMAGKTVSLLLYEWEGDTNGDFQVNPEEYNDAPIAFNSYTFSGQEDSLSFITIPVSVDDEGIPLKDDTHYIIMVQYAADDDVDMSLVASDVIDYGANIFRSDSLGKPRYAGVLDISNTGTFSLVGFGFDVVPLVYLHIGESPDLTTDARNILSPENKILVFPNPASERINVNVELVNRQDMTVQIYDMVGKVLFQQKYTGLQQGNFEFDVQTLPAGTYFLHVRAKDGVRTERFVVSK